MCYFFFNDTATTEIYTLSLHDALPISMRRSLESCWSWVRSLPSTVEEKPHCGERHSCSSGTKRDASSMRRLSVSLSSRSPDRKSTRLNSSHANISYAVFCLKKKKNYDI